MVVACLAPHLSLDQPTRRLEVQHGDLCRQQRRLHPLALARFLAFQKSDQDAQRRVKPGRQIGDGNADAHRALARKPGDGHQPPHALGDLIETGALGVGAVLAEAGDAGKDDAGVDGLQAFVIDAEAVFDIGAEIFHHHVGLFRQPHENLQPAGGLQIKRDAPLVAVDVLEIGSIAGAAHALGGVDFLGRLDLDHVGPPIGQLAHRRRARAHAGEIKDGEAGKRSGALFHRGSSGLA